MIPLSGFQGTSDSNKSSHTTRNRPNFIFILADDLGYADVGYNGGAAKTPNLDAMSRSPNSIKFNHFYSGSPVCSPTRGTVLTGRNHNRYCLWKANTPGRVCKSREDFRCSAQVYIPSYEVTIAEILKQVGYRTAAFGKWHLGDLQQAPGGLPRSNPGDNGFDVWKVTERSVPTSTSNCACFNTSLCNLGHYYRRGPPACTNYHEPDSKGGSDVLLGHSEPILKDDSDFIADMFETFLKDTLSESEQKPFFIFLPFHGVHIRYVASHPYNTLYTSNPKLSLNEIDYYGSISALDEAVGRVRQLLRVYNISDNTMLWFTSDNGPAKRSPGNTGGLRDRKGSVYEGGIRVPGIIEWPGIITSNRASNINAITSDFLPTLCDILEVSPPADRPLDGVSLLPHLRQQTEVRNESIKWAYKINYGNFNGRYTAALLEDRFKVVAEYRRGNVTSAQLFDIDIDRGESNDISLENPDTLKKLLKDLEDWRLSVITSATKKVRCL